MAGRNIDPGETPWDCAVREGLEETGLHLAETPRLLGVHFHTEREDWPALKLGVVFDGGQLTSEQISRIILDPGEHSELAIRCPGGMAAGHDEPAFLRLAAIADARRTGTACYLQETNPA